MAKILYIITSLIETDDGPEVVVEYAVSDKEQAKKLVDKLRRRSSIYKVLKINVREVQLDLA